jgi:uncharacterized protein YndB with AHSA1/START domain
MIETAIAEEIRITRVYDAPREDVWKAWTEPAQLAAWWGPRGHSTPLDRLVLDVRPGGTFRVTSIGEDGSEMTSDALFTDVVEPERLAFVEPAGWAGRAEGSVTFADLGDGRTEMVFHTTLEDPGEYLDAAQAGLSSAFDRLAEHLG